MNKGQELRAFVDRVDKKKPDAGAVKALREFLADSPGIWRNIGDLAEQANVNMIEAMQASTAMKESMKHGLAAMENELGQAGDGELERLIIQQIVGCWLRLSFVEYVLGRNSAEGNMNMRQGEYWERRVSSAQRRYLRAIETLARVRRLRLPSVQVNIGAQQVNQVNIGD